MQSHAIADPYWSAHGIPLEAVDRQDPVIWPNSQDDNSQDGNSKRAWSRSELERDERDGFHLAKSLFSESEAADLYAAARRLAEDADRRSPGVVVEPGSNVVRSLFRIHRTSDAFRELVRDPRLIDVARQVLGSEVYVHQSRINFKPAFDGREFFWHSDFETWHVEDGLPRMRAVSISISLTGSNEYNGPLMVVPGSHWTYVRCVGETPENHFEQSLKKQEYGVPLCEAMQELVDRGGITSLKGPPGSTIFFECNLMHGSAGNLSPHPRTNLFIVYNSVDNRVGDPFGDRPPRPDYLAERDIVPVGAWD